MAGPAPRPGAARRARSFRRQRLSVRAAVPCRGWPAKSSPTTPPQFPLAC